MPADRRGGLKMFGYSPAFPPEINDSEGHYSLNNTIKAMAIQNLRVLFLTSPGERLFNQSFGIGLRRYLFEQNTISTHIEIENRIREQVRTYIPYVTTVDIQFFSALTNDETPSNQVNLKYKFIINATGETAIIEF
jgi:hypothetical protein